MMFTTQSSLQDEKKTKFPFQCLQPLGLALGIQYESNLITSLLTKYRTLTDFSLYI